MEAKQIAIEFAKKWGFDTAKFRASRRGIDIYVPAMDNHNTPPSLGMPTFITVGKTGEADIVINKELQSFDELFPE
jgi:hypothetical protein